LISEPLSFVEVAAQLAFCRTVAHKVSHNLGFERAKQKVEKPGLAPVIAEGVYTN
jgi:hypothetical protein